MSSPLNYVLGWRSKIFAGPFTLDLGGVKFGAEVAQRVPGSTTLDLDGVSFGFNGSPRVSNSFNLGFNLRFGFTYPERGSVNLALGPPKFNMFSEERYREHVSLKLPIKLTSTAAEKVPASVSLALPIKLRYRGEPGFSPFTEINQTRTDAPVPTLCSGVWLTATGKGGDGGNGHGQTLTTSGGGGGGGGAARITRSFIPKSLLGQTYSVDTSTGSAIFTSGACSVTAGQGGRGTNGGQNYGGPGGAAGQFAISSNLTGLVTGLAGTAGAAGLNNGAGNAAANNTTGGCPGGGGGAGRGGLGATAAGGRGGNSTVANGGNGTGAGPAGAGPTNHGVSVTGGQPGGGGGGGGSGNGANGTGADGGSSGAGAGGAGGDNWSAPGGTGGPAYISLEWVAPHIDWGSDPFDIFKPPEPGDPGIPHPSPPNLGGWINDPINFSTLADGTAMPSIMARKGTWAIYGGRARPSVVGSVAEIWVNTAPRNGETGVEITKRLNGPDAQYLSCGVGFSGGNALPRYAIYLCQLGDHTWSLREFKGQPDWTNFGSLYTELKVFERLVADGDRIGIARIGWDYILYHNRVNFAYWTDVNHVTTLGTGGGGSSSCCFMADNLNGTSWIDFSDVRYPRYV